MIYRDDRILKEVGHRLSEKQLEALPKVLEHIYSKGESDLYFELDRYGTDDLAGDLKITTQDNPTTLKILTVRRTGKTTVNTFNRKNNRLTENYEL